MKYQRKVTGGAFRMVGLGAAGENVEFPKADSGLCPSGTEEGP